MWQVPHVSSVAAQLLADALTGGLAGPVQQRMLQGPALPDCLQQLRKSVLLSQLGDLEAVWADAGLRERLLGLSLPAMELLLSCDELKVATEDTVLYTARKYTSKLEAEEQQNHALKVLAPLVRCPHLSRYWLLGATHAGDNAATLLGELRPQLWKLVLLRGVDEGEGYKVEAADLQEGGRLAGAPPSWALGRRVSKEVSKAELVWQLDVSGLRDAVRRSASEKCLVGLHPPAVSPPLGGIAFGMELRCESKDAGVEITLYGSACNLCDGMFYKCTFTLRVENVGYQTFRTSHPYKGSDPQGWTDPFGLGCMAGGWDEAAWVGKGLPTNGQLTIKLTVRDVPHTPATFARRRAQPVFWFPDDGEALLG